MSGPVLITGAAGFAGSHLLDLLCGEGLSVAAWYRPGGRPPLRGEQPTGSGAATCWEAVDLLDRGAVADAIATLRPSAVYHCAGAAHVAQSWQDSRATLEINVLGTHHLIAAIGQAGLTARLLIPGSALVYCPSESAMAEDHPVGPNSPYGLSKLAQEQVATQALEADGHAALLARAFNHLGPRQDPSFAASSFARQIALIEAGRADPVIFVGNLDARRDLTDVRDTVRAYRLMMERGVPGRVYNVCSGHAYSVREILDGLLGLARVRIDARVDPVRFRPNDIPVLLGDSRRIREELGWQPQIPMDRSLNDLLDYWRRSV